MDETYAATGEKDFKDLERLIGTWFRVHEWHQVPALG